MRFFNTCLALTLATFLIIDITCQPNAKIIKSNSKLRMEIQNINNPDLLIIGLNNKNFTKLTKQEDIRIICDKPKGKVQGRLGAFVNNRVAKSVKCLEQGVFQGDIIHCVREEFRFTLPTKGYSYYDIYCRYFDFEGLISISTKVHRLCMLFKEILSRNGFTW